MATLYIFASVITISVVSFVGAISLLLNRERLNKSIFLLVSLAVGALLGDVFIHVLPEAYETLENPAVVSILTIAGILIFFIIEKFLHWHHHTTEHAEEHPHPTGNLILISDGVHNFIDGLIVGASYLVSTEVGIATTIAVVLHEIPQEIGNFGVLIHSGFNTAKALWYNFLSALTAILGAIVAILLGSATENFAPWLLPLTAGGFVYIALSDLVPELHNERKFGRSVAQVFAILIGVASMFLLVLFEG